MRNRDVENEFNYLKEKARMLKSLGAIFSKDSVECIECSECGLSPSNSQLDVSCSILELLHPDEAEIIVRKWAEEHPRKTRKDVLLEKFPNAKSNKDGVFYVCAYYLGVASKEYYDKCKGDCKRCWNEEVEE